MCTTEKSIYQPWIRSILVIGTWKVSGVRQDGRIMNVGNRNHMIYLRGGRVGVGGIPRIIFCDLQKLGCITMAMSMSSMMMSVS